MFIHRAVLLLLASSCHACACARQGGCCTHARTLESNIKQHTGHCRQSKQQTIYLYETRARSAKTLTQYSADSEQSAICYQILGARSQEVHTTTTKLERAIDDGDCKCCASACQVPASTHMTTTPTTPTMLVHQVTHACAHTHLSENIFELRSTCPPTRNPQPPHNRTHDDPHAWICGYCAHMQVGDKRDVPTVLRSIARLWFQCLQMITLRCDAVSSSRAF